ncbi:DUF4179 domain-containing protein [Paenibacillus tepidiphilus]|uniref:DUF4179 domain-containing protein n=1 Tax=Paenibacillus tepidiphilus TaxID=2608683 RepID=UPI0012398BC2|nr:DUF4179 domain-containing protein [Paenibacillus tepidiphilus]
MAVYKLEEEMKKLDIQDNQISPLVRTRLEETYEAISMDAGSVRRKKPSPARKFAYTAAASGILAAGMFASAFVSPVMADSLKKLPVIGSVFSSIQGDEGLRLAGQLGLTSNINRTVAYEDVKLEVTEALYDGNRVAFLLNVSAPNLVDGIYDNGRKKIKLSDALSQVTFTLDGKAQDEPGSIFQGGTFYGSAGEAYPNTLVFEQTVDPRNAPGLLDATFTLALDGIDHEFSMDIPFHKTTGEGIKASPNSVKSANDLTFSVADIWVTPVTTRLKTSIALSDAETLTLKEEQRLIRIGVAIFDDQGRRLTALNGDGIIEGNRLTFDRRYASQPGTSKYFTVKPFVIKDDFTEDIQDSQFLKDLEVRIELPAGQ